MRHALLSLVLTAAAAGLSAEELVSEPLVEAEQDVDDLRLPDSLQTPITPTPLKDIPDLVECLRSSDYDEREDAVRKLMRLGPEAREVLNSQLQKLTNHRSGTFEQVAALEAAIKRLRGLDVVGPFQKIRRDLKKQLLQAEIDLGAQDARVVEATRMRQVTQQAYQDIIHASERAIHCGGFLWNDDPEDWSGAINNAECELTLAEQRVEDERCEKNRNMAWRCVLETWREQLKMTLEHEAVPVETLEAIAAAGKWDNSALPLNIKLNVQVTFEFVDSSVHATCEHLSTMTGLEFEFAEGLDQQIPINLRVQQMEAHLSFEWVMRLCEYDWQTDRDSGKVKIYKPFADAEAANK
ncbi:MAG TPA: hypothetical protein VEJ63_09245 [Planctomycetota bacterium]|nr:hypothetical protein [Planctomycetota bacterium]